MIIHPAAIVTEADSSLGKAIADRLRGSYRVYALGSDIDLFDEQLLIDIRDEILETHPIAALVTCPSDKPCATSALEMSKSEWRSTVDGSLGGVFLANQVFGAAMVRHRYGRIVNVTSYHSKSAEPEYPAYTAVQSAAEGLTRALAVEWGRYEVVVNGVVCGPLASLYKASDDPERDKILAARTPTRRLGDVHDVSSVVTFLLSEEARQVNGQQIVVDGGLLISNRWSQGVCP